MRGDDGMRRMCAYVYIGVVLPDPGPHSLSPSLESPLARLEAEYERYEETLKLTEMSLDTGGRAASSVSSSSRVAKRLRALRAQTDEDGDEDFEVGTAGSSTGGEEEDEEEGGGRAGGPGRLAFEGGGSSRGRRRQSFRGYDPYAD